MAMNNDSFFIPKYWGWFALIVYTLIFIEWDDAIRSEIDENHHANKFGIISIKIREKNIC